jgi:hypothetical protein
MRGGRSVVKSPVAMPSVMIAATEE